ncbi:MAG: 50S ribosomal protein L18 [Erysipelotrichia bacterium]|nr:50S ribosomal protein L18 [Erysipelotrichia bacterium]
MIEKRDKNLERKRRHLRVRKKIFGTLEVPRLNVFRSTAHVYAQIIDDVNSVTLVSSNTLLKSLEKKLKGKNKMEQAQIIGEDIALKAKEKNIDKVVFDRAGYVYTCRIAALAEAARKAGLKF